MSIGFDDKHSNHTITNSDWTRSYQNKLIGTGLFYDFSIVLNYTISKMYEIVITKIENSQW